MKKDPRTNEKEAYRLLSERQYQEAAELFSEAGQSYRELGQHQSSAICFASAASCYSLASGEKTFSHAAAVYENAAKEAIATCDFEYAALLYKNAAVCYERDMEYMGFSECYFMAKECYRKFLGQCLFQPKKVKNYVSKKWDRKNLGEKAGRFVRWLGLTFSSLLWGHGERPQRTVVCGIIFILLTAGLFTQGYVLKSGVLTQLNFSAAVYFSVVTFTTVGYGDISPVGFNKLIAMIEAFGGLFIVPIFVTGLCRRYLRF